MDVDIEKTLNNLKREGFEAVYFANNEAAVEYLTTQIKGKTVGMGGSITLEELGLYDKLAENNTVYWHWRQPAKEARANSAQAEVYIASANAIAETGEIVNIDGTGNRVAATMYGHAKVYIIVGTNKLAPNCEQAIWRARNIAAPLNAIRLKCKTPCAMSKEMKCYDCNSPDRICRGLSVLMQKMNGNQSMEIVLINSKLGY